MIQKQLDEIKIANHLYNLDLAESDLEEIRVGMERFYDKVKKFNFSVSHWLGKVKEYSLIVEHYSSYITVKLVKEDSTKPFYTIKNSKFYFELGQREIEYIKILLDTFGYYPTDNATYQSLDEFKNHIIDKIADQSMNEQDLPAVFWLFNKEAIKLSHCKKDFLEKIYYVFERDNKRFYLTYDYGHHKIKTIDIKDPKYNYIDQDRLFKGDIFFQDIGEDVLEEDIVDAIPQGKFTVIDKNRYEAFKKEFELKGKIEKQEEELQDALSEEIARKVDNLGNEAFTFNNIKFSQHFIEYEGQKIGHETKEMKDFIKDHVSFKEDTNFNDIYTRFISRIGAHPGPVTTYLGNVLITVENKEMRSGNAVIATHSYINKVRINKGEVNEVLRRAICFNETSRYNDFLKEVSKCSIQFHNILNNGLQFDYHDNILDEEKYIKLKVVRKQNNNYLLADEKLFRIKDTSRLISKSSLNKGKRYKLHFSDLVTFLGEFFHMDADTIARVIKGGLSEYEEAIRKSEQLLRETIELFKVKEMEVEHKNTTYKGYLVKGKTKEYLLTKELKIFEYPSMKYVCIIDKALDNQVHNDKIVNRMYALANDSLIANKISTLSAS